MATPTREEQEDSFARQVYEAARAAGFAAQDQGSWVLRVRFLDKDEVGIGKELLCATSLDWKTLHHVALYVGSRAEGRSLFSLERQAEPGGYDALFSGEQFDDFKADCTAKLQQAETLGLNEVRAFSMWRLGLASPPLPSRSTSSSSCGSWQRQVMPARLRTWTQGASACTTARCANPISRHLDPLPHWFCAGRPVA